MSVEASMTGIATEEGTYMFNPRDEVCHLEPASPVHRELVDTPDEVVHGSGFVLLFCQYYAVHVLKKPLAPDNLAIF